MSAYYKRLKNIVTGFGVRYSVVITRNPKQNRYDAIDRFRLSLQDVRQFQEQVRVPEMTSAQGKAGRVGATEGLAWNLGRRRCHT